MTRPNERGWDLCSPDLSASPTSRNHTTSVKPALTPVPTAVEASCDRCGWWTLQPDRDAAMLRFLEAHRCGGDAS